VPDAQVAQLVEQRTENPRVGGSIPSLGTTHQFKREFPIRVRPIVRGGVMAIKFNSLTMENPTDTNLEVVVEAPIGTKVFGPAELPQKSTQQFDPSAKNVSSTRITIGLGGNDHDHDSSETIELNGNALQLYIQEVTATVGLFEFKSLTVKGSA
jgi:hypothetical protein